MRSRNVAHYSRTAKTLPNSSQQSIPITKPNQVILNREQVCPFCEPSETLKNVRLSTLKYVARTTNAVENKVKITNTVLYRVF